MRSSLAQRTMASGLPSQSLQTDMKPVSLYQFRSALSGSRNAGIGIKSVSSISISFVVNLMEDQLKVTKNIVLIKEIEFNPHLIACGLTFIEIVIEKCPYHPFSLSR